MNAPKWTPQEFAILDANWGKVRPEEIAKMVSRTRHAVCSAASNRGLTNRRRRRKWENKWYGKYKRCTPDLWVTVGLLASHDAGIDPVKMFAGAHDVAATQVRWAAWRSLAAAGYSLNTIGKASGFDHTSVRNAVLRGEPYQNARRAA